MSHASKTENRREVATPPRSLPAMRIEKFLKSVRFVVSSGAGVVLRMEVGEGRKE
jgi:hypothetical protein